ncbi:hypothetical protein RINTU1_35150 [Candidatus Regiella insecticola]|uniref:Uncharacterized protein n=1 Tax=Candidatus Regiella insecticola TaxID=138073 RepID=A0A6L2ZRE9_9ENTR|nr:hypothetical protein RINTU1_35150 [Candidatus Regiella insecticola]
MKSLFSSIERRSKKILNIPFTFQVTAALAVIAYPLPCTDSIDYRLAAASKVKGIYL